jgi:hypothetical protein
MTMNRVLHGTVSIKDIALPFSKLLESDAGTAKPNLEDKPITARFRAETF